VSKSWKVSFGTGVSANVSTLNSAVSCVSVVSGIEDLMSSEKVFHTFFGYSSSRVQALFSLGDMFAASPSAPPLLFSSFYPVFLV